MGAADHETHETPETPDMRNQPTPYQAASESTEQSPGEPQNKLPGTENAPNGIYHGFLVQIAQ